MIDQTMSFILYTIAGIAGGFLSSWMAFNASGEEFNPRKHGNALITGILTGLAFALVYAVVDTSEWTIPQFGVSVLTTFLAAAGVDRLRSSGSDMTGKNGGTPVTPTPTPTPLPTPTPEPIPEPPVTPPS